jgi:uncharacterized protein YyaL (SSP411 family)
MPSTQTMNRLIHETSPYLLHHAHNPVDWYPWGDEAFVKAKAENKPILLSCGYQACHWCHVMERESFEDEDTAGLINKYFVSVKVDREERPDVDQVYQEAIRIMGVQGGWPLTVFLTPEGKPFFGGTYFPPEPSYGRPSFRQVLTSVAQAWQEKKEDLLQQSQMIGEILTGESRQPRQLDSIAEITPEEVIYQAIQDMVSYVDRRFGGFGHNQKFPAVSNLMLMLAHGHLQHLEEPVELALMTLRQMAQGGIHDQIGGGFHRYATDAKWLVPHFEKMLYDNAQLLEAYTTAWKITREQEFLDSAQSIVDYLHREMLAPEGVFYATQDADSEGVEGKYYVWSYDDLRVLLREEKVFEAFSRFFGVTPSGNFEGKNILHQAVPLQSVAQSMGLPLDKVKSLIDAAKDILFAHRENRIKPFRDEKAILSWNGLTISGLCRFSQAQGDRETLKLAQNAASFILQTMTTDSAHLLRIYKDNQAKIPAFLDDYAFLTAGLIDLFETDLNPYWLSTALTLIDTVLGEYKKENGQYALGSLKNGNLFEQPISGMDQAIPSGVGIHCQNLIRMHMLTGKDSFRREAEAILGAYIHDISAQPFSYASLVTALDMFWCKPAEIIAVNVQNDPANILRKLHETFIPYRSLTAIEGYKPADEHPAAHLFADRKALNDQATFYICSDFTCHPPVTTWEEVEGLLGVSNLEK